MRSVGSPDQNRQPPTARTNASNELRSVVADGVVPVMLLRRRSEQITVEAAPGTSPLASESGEALDVVLDRASAAELVVPLTDATLAAATHRDVIRLDLVDRAAGQLFEARTLRFLPVGGDLNGEVDLVLVLRDAESVVRDALTGLPGRDLLTDRWAVAVARARRLRSTVGVVLSTSTVSRPSTTPTATVRETRSWRWSPVDSPRRRARTTPLPGTAATSSSCSSTGSGRGREHAATPARRRRTADRGEQRGGRRAGQRDRRCQHRCVRG